MDKTLKKFKLIWVKLIIFQTLPFFRDKKGFDPFLSKHHPHFSYSLTHYL